MYSTHQKNFTCPFRLTDRPFPLYFLSQLCPHPFNIRLISACVLSPFVCKNSRFGARFSTRVNCYSVGRTARELEMVYNEYTKHQILFFHAKGYRAPTITKWLGDEGIVVSKQVVGSFLARVEKTGSIGRWPGSRQSERDHRAHDAR